MHRDRISPTLRRALIENSPQRVLRVWSFQDPAGQAAAEERGYWTVPPGFYDAPENGLEHEAVYCRQQYDFMREQMAKRLPASSGDWPIWAWITRPNLRQMPWNEDPSLLLVADVPLGRALVHDYECWCQALNFGICAASEEEDACFDKRYLDWGDWHPARPDVIETWQRMFDLVPHPDPAVRHYSGHGSRYQAAVDRIFTNEIISARLVQGRKGKRATKCFYGGVR